MPRKPRIEIAGGLYHVITRGNNRRKIFRSHDDYLSRIMQRVLTSYSQYYNRRYKKIGHLFQGRYKSILCQTDRYLGELVRYIHLNPVRAKLVKRPENFKYSGHRAYLGLDIECIESPEPGQEVLLGIWRSDCTRGRLFGDLEFLNVTLAPRPSNRKQ